MEQERGGEPAQELEGDGAEDPEERVPEAQPEDVVVQEARVVGEPDDSGTPGA